MEAVNVTSPSLSQIDVLVSSQSQESKNNVGVIERITQASLDGVKGCFSSASGFLQGIAIWSGVQGVLAKGCNFQVLHQAIFQPELFISDSEGLKEIFDKWVVWTREKGATIHEGIDSEAILHSSCPKREYHAQMSKALDREISSESMVKTNLMAFVAIPALGEELVFRGLLQDLILNRLAKKVVQQISPQYASVVDSKVYAAYRILFTSLCFSASHNGNRGLLPDSYVDMQLYATFVMGIAFGILKETYGLSACMGAHAIQNLVATAPIIFGEC